MDELANITTARDGKEEMVRCEEIFRQICWLEERFWPDVDGMGEQDETARLGPPGLSTMSNGTFTAQNMGGPMNNNPMGPMNGQLNSNRQMNGPIHNNGMNAPINNTGMSGLMTNTGMNGPITGGPQVNNNINGGQMNSNINGGQLSSGESTPDADGDSGFGQMSQMPQGS